MNILLIGDLNNKRSDYFIKAAQALNHDVKVVNLENYYTEKLDNYDLVKIDPPIYTEYEIGKLPEIIESYNEKLKELQEYKNINFLNKPEAILDTLDKVKCKEILKKNNISITPMIEDKIQNYEELVFYMEKKNLSKVFIKPRYGSGAAGVLAFRYNKKTKEGIVYTAASLNEDMKLYNTKKMKKIKENETVKSIIDIMLKDEVIIEKWIPKSKYKDLSYDLRVVYQFGKIDFIVARGSKTPITNLHLNNCAIDIEDINLSERIMNELKELCYRVVSSFECLNSAGIDVLITPKGKLKVIEVNGQGDLIYKDIFNENTIYKSQITGGLNTYGRLK